MGVTSFSVTASQFRFSRPSFRSSRVDSLLMAVGSPMTRTNRESVRFTCSRFLFRRANGKFQPMAEVTQYGGPTVRNYSISPLMATLWLNR